MTRSTLILAASIAAPIFAGPPEQPKVTKPIPPPVSTGSAPAPAAETYVYEQKPTAGRPVLVSPEQAKGLIERFKATYPKLGSPRMVVYVNRELIDESSGLKLSGRTEKIQSNTTDVKNEFKADPNAPQRTNSGAIPSASNVTIVGNVNGRQQDGPGTTTVQTRTEKKSEENTYKVNERNQGTLADKQTVRDIERLFGRPLRMAGVTLADQRVASQLIGESAKHHLGTDNEQARKDREALSKIADVALEILISSRQITVPEVSGDKTYAVPDIQATAVRLADARLLGQATATDIIGKDQYAGNIVRNFDVREIAEATALALMEDMLLNAPE